MCIFTCVCEDAGVIEHVCTSLLKPRARRACLRAESFSLLWGHVVATAGVSPGAAVLIHLKTNKQTNTEETWLMRFKIRDDLDFTMPVDPGWEYLVWAFKSAK